MYILDLEIENQKTIKCFKKTINGDNLEIAGDTGTGKTTAVSALWEVLEKGTDTLSHGASKGVIRVSIGDESDTVFVAERVNTPKTSKTTISKVIAGRPVPITTKDFDQMLSKLSVNPHRIAEMKPKERTIALLSAANVSIDVGALDAEIKALEDERLYAGRKAEDAKPFSKAPEKAEPVVISSLIAERDAGQKRNEKIANAKKEIENLCKANEDDAAEIDELNKKIAQLSDAIAVRSTRIENGEKWLTENPTLSFVHIDEQLASAEETNRKAAVYATYQYGVKKYEELIDAHKEADRKVKERYAYRKQVLDSAKWPIEGLTISDGDVYYNGILFDNLGESEQMLVTAAIALGDIEKHDIKIVRMDGVESMSKKDYETLRTLFNERGVQVLSTRVSRGGIEQNEIEIVDGIYTEENNDGK